MSDIFNTKPYEADPMPQSATISNTFNPLPYAQANVANAEANGMPTQQQDAHEAAITADLQSKMKMGMTIANNLQALKDAQQAHDQRGDLLDIEKKKADIAMQEAVARGQITAAQARVMDTLTKEQLGQAQQVHDAQGTLINQANEQTQTQAKALAEQLQNHPIHDLIASGQIGNIMQGPSPAQPNTAQMDAMNPTGVISAPVNGSMPQQAAAQDPAIQGGGAPVIPVGDNVIQQPMSTMQDRISKMYPGMTINPNWVAGQDKAEMFMKDPNAAKKAQTIGSIGDISGMSPEDIMGRLQKTDPAYAKFLQNVYEGKVDVKSRGGQANKIMEDVGAIFPDFDATTYQTKLKTRQDFTSGKTSQNIVALNTATQHLDTLNNLIPALDNSKIRKYNSIKNYLSQETGSPAVRQFKFVANALSGELGAIFKSSGATDSEINNIKGELDSADSTEQLQSVVKSAVDLMKGRMNGLQDKWQNAYGENSQFPVISKRSQAVFQKLGGDDTMSSGIPDGRVAVVSPDGRVGHIPATQLNDAIKAGYKRQ